MLHSTIFVIIVLIIFSLKPFFVAKEGVMSLIFALNLIGIHLLQNLCTDIHNENKKIS
jgi:hypothetical protein